jgi:hypothetical protein
MIKASWLWRRQETGSVTELKVALVEDELVIEGEGAEP